ncbi:DNA repair protein Rad60 [Drosophila kikkawai]|uniref:DNA repair protein Rad60 n=1 Tax=Drosophila kikkawai TaxID=30033 RepID=A0A6P4I4C8_DROKI|nr:uncharacterized protein CG4449 [Drosophila kikkawai]
MSDDDFDIFSAACRRAPRDALPLATFDNPCDDSFSKETDYDFLGTSTKKTSRVRKAKVVTEPQNKVQKSKKKEEIQKDEQVPPEPAEKQLDSARSLSPVSQLILEMDQKQATDVAPLIPEDSTPVARRTRSSQGKQEIRPDPVEPVAPVVPVVVQPKKRNTRSKKKTVPATGGTVEDVSSAVVSSLNSIVASFSHATRRTQIAEIAARSQVLDSIDLVSAVPPRVEGFVNLDSDDEGQATAVVEEASDVFDADNPTMEVALSWLGEIQVYKLRQHQKFKHMFKEVAERNGVHEDNVSMDMYYKFIGPDDTPHSIGLKSFHTLSGHATKSGNKTISKNDNHQEDLSKKPRKFQLKVQAAKWKHPLVVSIKKKDPFKVLYIKCAEELNVEARLIKLFFDGDLLDPEDTPKNQDMEGNEMIDLELKS